MPRRQRLALAVGAVFALALVPAAPAGAADGPPPGRHISACARHALPPLEPPGVACGPCGTFATFGAMVASMRAPS